MDYHVFSLGEVLAVAKLHPFYNKDAVYPPGTDAVEAIIKEQAEKAAAEPDLKQQPLLWKHQLYTSIQRLVNDTSPENTYRRNAYVSTTGGGSSPIPLMFATDNGENRRHRMAFGQFLRRIEIVTPGDWVLSVHTSGKLYRSLDLSAEILENAGASVLCAGHLMPPNKVCKLLAGYHINALTGDSSQVTQIVHSISTLPPAERDKIRLEKIIYTSEMLTPAQRSFIRQVLGPIKIYSMMASAETGPWAASNPDFTGLDPGFVSDDTVTKSADFIFDMRATRIEIIPSSCLGPNPTTSDPLPDGEQGIVVATSLSRLRHPLVRYVTGDVGSIHPLPDHARAKLSDAEWQHLRILRLVGRDRRLSFDFDGEYIEFTNLAAVMEKPEFAILQWQVILGRVQPSNEASLEVRILFASREGDSSTKRQRFTHRLETFFNVGKANRPRFRLVFVTDMNGFERSSTGRKVVKFIDHYN